MKAFELNIQNVDEIRNFGFELRSEGVGYFRVTEASNTSEMNSTGPGKHY